MADDKLKREKELFKKHSQKLEKEYPEKFVAIKDGRIVDYDRDIGRLCKRIMRRFGDNPVHIREAKDMGKLKLPARRRKRWV